MAKKTKLQLMTEELISGDETRISEAIKLLETEGNASMIRPIAECLKSTSSKKIEGEILGLFANLKDSRTLDEIMDVIRDADFLMIRQNIIGSLWGSSLDFSPYLAEFVQAATESDYLFALDCLNVIEQMEGPFDEESVLESQLSLSRYMESDEKKEEKKALILSDLAVIIKRINEGLSDL